MSLHFEEKEMELLTRQALDGTRALISLTGRDPFDSSVIDTPQRVMKAFLEMTSGYNSNPDHHLNVNFDSPAYNDMVVLKGVRFTSLCEHHLLPFSGVATVGYIPSGNRVVGLSKLARVVDGYAKRLQLQERLTHEICLAVSERLSPIGCGCVIKASHSCLSCRGAMKQDAEMVTSSLYGVFMDIAVRSEFLSLAAKE